MSDPACVVFLAPNWLGDAVMALPAMADVKRHFAAARVVVAARPAVAALYSMARVDEVVGAEASALRATGAELAILFPNSFGSARLARQAGIAERWGYAADFRGPLLTRAVRRPRRSMHQGAYYQYLVQALGIDNGPLEPRVDVPPAVTAAARAAADARLGRNIPARRCRPWRGVWHREALAAGALRAPRQTGRRRARRSVCPGRQWRRSGDDRVGEERC
jgi:heptosyltransferase-2